MKNFFSSKATQEEAKPAKRSLFRQMNTIRTDGLLSPLFESTKIFVQLVAQVFAIYKLLPMDYPGLRDANANLKLWPVIADAWANVKFTREGAPQAILFFAVLAIMIIGTFFVLSFFFSLFLGHAHAADGQCLYPQSSDSSIFGPVCNDTAQAWLDFLFSFGNLPLANASDQAPAYSWGIQGSIQTVLGFYSDAMLIIAAIILFYHLTQMVLETAHTGVPMGKPARQIWAPMRLVLAVGLLVPIAGGLNSGQYITIKMASLGSGFASQVWSKFASAMVDPNSDITAMTPIVTDIGAKMIKDYACAIDYNTRLNNLIFKIQYDPDISELIKYQQVNTLKAQLIPGNPGPDMTDTTNYLSETNPWPPAQTTTSNGVSGTKYVFSVNTLDKQALCGWFFIPKSPTTDTDAAAIGDPTTKLAQQTWNEEYQAFVDQISANQNGFIGAAKKILDLVNKEDGGNNDNTTPIQIDTTFIDAVHSYQTDLRVQLSSPKNTQISGFKDLAEMFSDYGWAFAGTFFSTIERIEDKIVNALQSGVPQAGAPSIGSGTTTTGNEDYVNLVNIVAKDLSQFDMLSATGTMQAPKQNDIQCASMLNPNPAPTTQSTGQLDLLTSLTTVASGAISGTALIAAAGALTLPGIGDALFALGAAYGIWVYGAGDSCANTGLIDQIFKHNATFKLGITMTNGVETLKELSEYGHQNLLYGIAMTGLGAASYILSATITGLGTIQLAGFGGLESIAAPVAALIMIAAAIMEFLGFVFLTVGFTFTFILPLIPFTRFFFAVVIWFGELLEAVVAIPLVALAHLNPDGEGFIGDQAKKAYYFIFSIFLRPVMTIFGLIIGLLIFIIAANFATYAYGVAVASTGGTGGDWPVPPILSATVFTTLYAYLMFTCANKSFEMITHLPNTAVMWMGASKSPTPNLGDIGEMQRFEQLVGGFVASQGAGAIAKGGQSAGNSIKGIADDKKAKKEKDKQETKDKKNAQEVKSNSNQQLVATKENTAASDLKTLMQGNTGQAVPGGQANKPEDKGSENDADRAEMAAGKAEASANEAQNHAQMGQLPKNNNE